jgi:predicted RNase H-like nuclease (RuvC/YqgF family)
MVAGFLAGVASAQEGQTTPVPTNGPWRPTTGKIEDLRKKAQERDEMADKVQTLETMVSELRGQLRNANARVNDYALRTRPSRLEKLENKASKYESLHSELAAKDKKIDELTKALEEKEKKNSGLEKDIKVLRSQVEDLIQANTKLEMAQKSLQDSIEQLLLGNFEYYQVKKGDTLKTIAESPLVYGDSKKAEWIRQANYRRVEDLDELRPGEMLIIPRFPPSGRYEF